MQKRTQLSLYLTSPKSEAIEALRRVLGDHPARLHAPHLTLAHPRNPRAPGNTAENIPTVPAGLEFSISEVSLIQQVDGGVWRVVARFGVGEAEGGGRSRG